MNHRLEVAFDASSENESLARMIASAFMAAQNPTLEEIEDVKTAVSEAVTNAIIHGYDNDSSRTVYMDCTIKDRLLTIKVRDNGVGMADVKAAMEPFFTTRGNEERSGMGFSFMEAFMDEIRVTSKEGEGTCVTMLKRIGSKLS